MSKTYIHERTYITIQIQKGLKTLVIKELKKYIDALNMENEVIEGGSLLVNKDIEAAEDLYVRLKITISQRIEMPFEEFTILHRMLHCSISVFESLGVLENSIMIKAYKELYQNSEELFALLKGGVKNAYKN